MGPFLKKDLILLWRDRKEMLISLITPILLIVFMGTTLSSWVEKPNESLEMTVAVVHEDNEEAALLPFKETLTAMKPTGQSAASLGSPAEQWLPSRLLQQCLSGVPFVKTVALDHSTAGQRLRDGDVTAIITIPEGFTAAMLKKMIHHEGNGAAFLLTADRRASMRVDVLQNLLDGYLKKLNLHTAIGHVQGDELNSPILAPNAKSIGGNETITGVAPLTSFQYYAIAISIIFALFVSSAAAMKAIPEKREQVFQRILLSGSHPLRYLAGKVGSSFCMALLQFTILIVASHFIFHLFPGRSFQFWAGIALISIMFSLSVAALSSLFTSLIFRMKDAAANGVFTLILGVMGSIGGSLIPLYILPDWLKQAGEWTPNGLTLSVLIQWIGQDSLTLLAIPFLKLTMFSIALIVLGAWTFPKRGRI